MVRETTGRHLIFFDRGNIMEGYMEEFCNMKEGDCGRKIKYFFANSQSFLHECVIPIYIKIFVFHRRMVFIFHLLIKGEMIFDENLILLFMCALKLYSIKLPIIDWILRYY